MKNSDILRDLASLPPEAQQQVLDLITLLKTRCRTARRQKTCRLVDEPFIGMWRDRDDMQDSAAWVRRLRRREWE